MLKSNHHRSHTLPSGSIAVLIKHFFFTALFLPLCFIFAITSATARDHSSQRGDFYIAIDGAYTDISVENVTFNPTAARLKLGAFILDNIAMELQFGSGIDAESPLKSSDMEVGQSSAIYGRFQSPSQSGFRIYLQVGYHETELIQTFIGSGDEIEETFKSYSHGIGIEQQIKYLKSLYLFLEASQLVNDDLDMDSTNLGLRFEF